MVNAVLDVVLSIVLVGVSVLALYVAYLLWARIDAAKANVQHETEDRLRDYYTRGYETGFEDGHYEGRVVASEDADRAPAAI